MTGKAPASPKTPPAESPSQSTVRRTVAFLARFERYAADFGGIFLLSLALLTLAALLAPSLTSGLLALWGGLLRRGFGYGAVWVALFSGWLGLWLLRRPAEAAGRAAGPRSAAGFWGRFFSLEVAAFTSLALLSVMGGVVVERADAGLDGGRVGWGLAALLYMALDEVGLGRLWLSAVILGLVGLFFLALGLGKLGGKRRDASPMLQSPAVDLPGLGVVEAPLVGVSTHEGAGDDSPPAAKRRSPIIPPQFRKNFRIDKDSTPPSEGGSIKRDDRLPGLDLLVQEQASRPDERTINQIAGLIEKTLAEFSIPATVIDFRVGPTVTQFAVVPGYVTKDKPNGDGDVAKMKVRVAQISSLSRDLALALSAQRLRIEAPVPGRPYVGIEVPNPRAAVVRLRPILEHDAFLKTNAPLAVALGRDVSGAPVVADLSKMPHLLIAGTTGSGKSVCIAALTTCLVMSNLPDDLRLVMIDPKMVELIRFNGLPHLYGKVETDVERILGVLAWAVAEMDRRYKLLETYHSRNIEAFNRRMARHSASTNPDLQPLPRLVLLIDELADLMMSAPEQTEHNLVRLAQMARAVGIHLVVATQRPGVEVITGLIKANFPARISFTVASSIDSRVILDTVGAETLLGRGDMLFLPPDASGPQRVQGVMVTDAEVEKIITFWQKSRPAPAQAEPAPWDVMIAEQQVSADRDDLVERAIALVRREQRCSASMLQRRLRVGFPRAARLVEELEEMGVVASASGGREREVLLPPEDDEYQSQDE